MRRVPAKTRDATPDSNESDVQVIEVKEEESDSEEISYEEISSDESVKQEEINKEEESDNQGGGDARSRPRAKKSARRDKILNTIVDEEGTEMIQLSSSRFVSVSEYKGNKLVCIREYFKKDGKRLPTKKGINLNLKQYENLKKAFQHIDDNLAKE